MLTIHPVASLQGGARQDAPVAPTSVIHESVVSSTPADAVPLAVAAKPTPDHEVRFGHASCDRDMYSDPIPLLHMSLQAVQIQEPTVGVSVAQEHVSDEAPAAAAADVEPQEQQVQQHQGDPDQSHGVSEHEDGQPTAPAAASGQDTSAYVRCGSSSLEGLSCLTCAEIVCIDC